MMTTDDEQIQDKRPVKRQKLKNNNADNSTIVSATEGFNAQTNVDNILDLRSTIPILPRDCKVLLLDIEGCTTSISFVHDVLFPFVKDNLVTYLKSLEDRQQQSINASLDYDFEILDSDHPSRHELSLADAEIEDINNITEVIVHKVLALMKHDVKATGLKSLQGQIWKKGYENGNLKGHVYQDFVPMLQWCNTHNVQINIYSSGSIGAQKLLFGNSVDGNLLQYITNHFDTTSGGKKESTSYQTIAKQLNVGKYNINKGIIFSALLTLHFFCWSSLPTL